MFRCWLPWLVIVGATVVVGGETFYYYPQLLDPAASHFNAQGQPDSWMPKEKFVGVMAGSWVVVLMFLAVPPLFMSRVPTTLINLPHKEYWLAPERVATTRQMLAQRITWCGAATMLLLAYSWHGTLQANLPPNPPLDIWTPLTVYLVFVGLWCAELIGRFARPSKSSEPPT